MKVVPVSILVPYIFKDNSLKVWMQRRDSQDHLNGTLEFPGGKIESNEKPIEACSREVLEETGVKVNSPQLFKLYSHAYEDKTVLLHVFMIESINLDFSRDMFYKIDMKWLEDNKNNIPNANLGIFKDFIVEFLT